MKKSSLHLERKIFKNSSSTFFLASVLFPGSVKRDVFDLYSFVRTADDYVDKIPPDAKKFYKLREKYAVAIKDPSFDTSKQKSDSVDLRVVKNMIRLVRSKNIPPGLVEDFLGTMESDINFSRPVTMDDSLKYVYGSAETVGLMMAKLMGLSKEAEQAARLQARAFQWINFIRDVKEDNELGRIYFPKEDLDKFGLTNLSLQTAKNQPDEFNGFMGFQISRYRAWQDQATRGYKLIPRRLLIPLEIAAIAYSQVAAQIGRNPFVVFERKVRPKQVSVLVVLSKKHFK